MLRGDCRVGSGETGVEAFGSISAGLQVGQHVIGRRRGGGEGRVQRKVDGAGHELQRAARRSVALVAADRQTERGAVNAELMGAAGAGVQLQPGFFRRLARTCQSVCAAWPACWSMIIRQPALSLTRRKAAFTVPDLGATWPSTIAQ